VPDGVATAAVEDRARQAVKGGIHFMMDLLPL